MSKHHVLYPDKIGLVDQAEVQDDTFHNVDNLLTNGFNDFQLGTEAISVTKGHESFEPEIFTPNGHLKIDSLITARMCSIQLTLGAWYHAVQAIREGMHPDDVATDYQVNLSGAAGTPDVSDAEAAVAPETLINQQFTLLVRFPIRNPSDKHLYLYVPKCAVVGDQPESTMQLDSQQTPAVNLEALALLDTELAKHQGIFSGVNASNVAYFFTAGPAA